MRWLPIPGTDGRYEISDHGEARRADTGKLLLGHVDRKGYRYFTIRRVGMSPRPKAHRLVLEAFVGPAADGMLGLHADDDPSNNHLENLRWGTPAENMADRKRNSGWDLGPRHNGAKTHCPQGHEYTPENTTLKFYSGYYHRSCRACNREVSRRQYERQKARRTTERS